MSWRELSVLIGLCCVWGLHFTVVKLAVASIPPLFYVAVRMSLVALLLIPFLRWHQGQMARVLAAGLCLGCVNYALLFSGTGYANASTAALANELYIPFSSILSVIFLKEYIGWRRASGIVLAILGVALIAVTRPNVVDDESHRMVLGVMMVGSSAFIEAVGVIFIKKIDGIKPFELLAWFAVVGAVVMWPATFLLEQGQVAAITEAKKSLVIGALLYSVLMASIFGHTAFYWLLQRLPVSQVTSSSLLTSVMAVFFGVVLLGEPVGLSFLIGGVMTLTGVAIIVLRTPPPPAKSSLPAVGDVPS